ncbi:MAG: amidase [Acidobacteria bacterium]|nr:amidase [Acidobacteriota bacterium]
MHAEPHTIAEFARALRAHDLTAEVATERCLESIAARNPSLNAFITVFADQARAQARQADVDLSAGRDRGPLHGVPLSIKDLFDVAGAPTTAASRVRAGHMARNDAAAVRALRAGGAILVGKNNLHEFALGPTNEDSAFGPARHPLDPRRSPGGSSGGSAASVLAGMAYASIGTDTGGSIRIPAAACGLVGLKPGFGEISTDGVVPLSVTLDHVGPICRSATDARILYDALRGEPSPVATGTRRNLRGLRLGVLRDYFMALLDPEVESAFHQACLRMREAGAELRDAVIPHAGDIGLVYTRIVLSEAAAYHAATLERQPDLYTPNVRLRLERGRGILSEDYAQALREREVLREDVDRALRGCDALVLPTLPIPAPTIGADVVRLAGADEPIRNVMLRLTQLFNLTGHPAMTLPCGTSAEGFPVGAQLVGSQGGTAALLDLAAALEPCLATGMSR